MMTEHATTVEVQPRGANFLVSCSCGKRIYVASLSREFAERSAARHVEQVRCPVPGCVEDRVSGDHTSDLCEAHERGVEDCGCRFATGVAEPIYECAHHRSVCRRCEKAPRWDDEKLCADCIADDEAERAEAFRRR